ncbi:MAG TPA: acyl-CoA desaturase [Terriglobales bacterium]|nr:acyl-CoA desaturase [Terriglobales bacterium]
MSFQKGDRTFRESLNPVTTFFMVAFHIGAIAAFFFVSWKAIAVAAALWVISGSFGIGMGYHRLLTHRGYKTPKWLEYLLTTFGTLALEGGPIYWVATHRLHHQNTDVEGDPHTPLEGGFWSHIGWIVTGKTIHNDNSELLPYVPDLRKDRFHMWISKWHWVPLTLLGLALLFIGGWPYLMWGTFFRTTIGLHFTFLVNSATHMWGSQRFLTGDKSTNSFWVAIVSFGEGWHNNHHAHPQSARHGLVWWEIDWNWYCISFLKMVGLAWDVKLPRLAPAPLTVPQAVETPAEEELATVAGD